jgi:hypothetical protein
VHTAFHKTTFEELKYQINHKNTFPEVSEATAGNSSQNQEESKSECSQNQKEVDCRWAQQRQSKIPNLPSSPPPLHLLVKDSKPKAPVPEIHLANQAHQHAQMQTYQQTQSTGFYQMSDNSHMHDVHALVKLQKFKSTAWRPEASSSSSKAAPPSSPDTLYNR